MSSDRPARGSSDDLRSVVRPALNGPTFVLAMFSLLVDRWVAVARSERRARLDALCELLPPLTGQHCEVVEVACDPENLDVIVAAVDALPVPGSVAELRDHFEPYVKPLPRGLS